MLKVVDAQLGPLHITWRRGARHISFRPLRTGEGFSITIPAFVSAKGYQSIVEQLRPRLLVLKAEREKLSPVCLLTPSCHLDVPDFSLSWQSYTGHLIRFRMEQEHLTIFYPPSLSFSLAEVQQSLVCHIERALFLRAKDVLPLRLSELAQQRGLSIRHIQIRKTRSRWGSCSSRGHISLSLYLLLLPLHLQEYIMHHELTHLMEMNHGPRFHTILNEVLNGKESAFREELKGYDTNIFSAIQEVQV